MSLPKDSHPSIGHCLWFDHHAEEAARFYTSLFKDGKIGQVTRYTDVASDVHGQKPGSVMAVEFEIAGQRYVALNGGPLFKFSEAFSIMVYCDTQEEIDFYSEKLTADGGEQSHCGWLRDRFGLSWQITPRFLDEMLVDKDPERVRRVTAAFMAMKKFDLAALRRAYDGR